jgi:protein-S-isoprenylcysteine O-methyltransferase Ste14
VLEFLLMNILNPWNTAFFIAFVVLFWTRGVFFNRTKNEKKIEKRYKSVERSLQAALFLGTLPLPFLYLLSPWLAFADYELPLWASAAGVICLVASLWLFWRSHVDLGQNWSVTLEVRAGHQLITEGVYKSMRHPMYSSVWLWGIGQGLVLQNWLAGWSFASAFAVMYFFRIPREEQLMLDHFPKEYPEYMRKTGRIIPRLFQGNITH